MWEFLFKETLASVSETGLELVKRVALSLTTVWMFIRGWGDFWGDRNLHLLKSGWYHWCHESYGASAVRNSSSCSVGHLSWEFWKWQRSFDRLETETKKSELQGVKIPCVRIPVKTGRNVSVVIEAAAMNYQSARDWCNRNLETVWPTLLKNGED